MGFFRYLILLFCLCTITLTQAQRYEVDCLVSSEIKAVATDKPTEFDGPRTVLDLSNGTLVNVVGRKVGGAHATHAAPSAVSRRCRGLTSGVTAHAGGFCIVLFKDRLRFGKTLSSKLECFSLTLHYLCRKIV